MSEPRDRKTGLFSLFSLPYAKKLKRLHASNGWLVLALTVTGVLLFVPAFRTAVPQIRLWTKELHIALGLISLLPIVLYIPLSFKHMRQIRRNRIQLWNLRIVLFILSGWMVSGLILWQHKLFAPSWNNAALFWHDLFSWVGLPYVVFHSVTRMRWVKRAGFKPLVEQAESESLTAPESRTGRLSPAERLREQVWANANKPPISRRTFIQLALGFLLVLSVGPSFYKWLKKQVDFGGSAFNQLAQGPIDPNVPSDASQMIPPPEPLPSSNPPIGGGANGQFRIYTVTRMPDSRAETWSFKIGGLVDRPVTYDWERFMELKREVQVSDFHCVTGWSVYSCTWEGIKLSAMLEAAGVQAKAKHVKFYSGDGVYTDTLTLEQAKLDDVMVAALLDGKPIPKNLGGPVRLIVPKMYAYKSVKWLQAIELIEQEENGYWIERGYPKDAWV